MLSKVKITKVERHILLSVVVNVFQNSLKFRFCWKKIETTYFRCSRFFDVRDSLRRRINREHRGILRERRRQRVRDSG